MEEASIVNAVERIGAALERLEAIPRKNAELGARHARLKASVARSLQELDELIAEAAR